MDPSRSVRCDSPRRNRSPRRIARLSIANRSYPPRRRRGRFCVQFLAMNCQATIIQSLRDKGASPFAVSLVRRFADTLSLELLELLM